MAALLPFFAFGVMGAADVKVFAVLGAWCGMHALLGLWMAASFAAAVHALWLLITTRTRLAGLLRSHGVTFELAGKPSTPYAACLTVAASVWLVLQGLAGGLR
ncbi:Flp pilus assembly protein protease CpaA [Paraburkholderia fungorum]|nr:Flp pilus assembly protein protease CpaA [Paraburkholderia fungorum]